MPQKLTWDGGGGITKPKTPMEDVIANKTLQTRDVQAPLIAPPPGGVPPTPIPIGAPMKPKAPVGGMTAPPVSINGAPMKPPMGVPPTPPVQTVKDPYGNLVGEAIGSKPFPPDAGQALEYLSQGKPVDREMSTIFSQLATSPAMDPKIAALLMRVSQGQPVDDQTAMALYQLATSKPLDQQQSMLVQKLAMQGPMSREQALALRQVGQSSPIDPKMGQAIAQLSSKTGSSY